MAPALLTLPLEIRQLIYEHLFGSYVVRHGFGRTPPVNRAAILQTCKQIYLEAWPFLPLNVDFHFRCTEAMLDTLLSVDQAVVTRVRRIRVKAFPFPLYATGRGDFYSIYYFDNALSLLPGLHLEQLTVEDAYHGYGLLENWRDLVTYFDIEALLQSDAWKELVYITPNTDFIASGYDHRRKRVAQPENWNMMLSERDGKESGAEVQMFINVETRSSDATEEATLRPWSAKPGHEVNENFRIAGPDQDLKGEVRIVARRGKRAAYVQTGLSEKRTWKELKNQEGGFKPEGEAFFFDNLSTQTLSKSACIGVPLLHLTIPPASALIFPFERYTIFRASLPIIARSVYNLLLMSLSDWTPYYNNMADAVGWIYGGWGRRMQLANMALSH